MGTNRGKKKDSYQLVTALETCFCLVSSVQEALFHTDDCFSFAEFNTELWAKFHFFLPTGKIVVRDGGKVPGLTRDQGYVQNPGQCWCGGCGSGTFPPLPNAVSWSMELAQDLWADAACQCDPCDYEQQGKKGTTAAWSLALSVGYVIKKENIFICLPPSNISMYVNL